MALCRSCSKEIENMVFCQYCGTRQDPLGRESDPTVSGEANATGEFVAVEASAELDAAELDVREPVTPVVDEPTKTVGRFSAPPEGGTGKPLDETEPMCYPISREYSESSSYVPFDRYPNIAEPEAFERPPHGGQLAFAIVNMVLGLLCCCVPFPTIVLGVIATIMSVGASKATSLEASKAKLKSAKILNIIAIILFAVVLLFFSLLMLLDQGSGTFREILESMAAERR